MLEDIIKFTKSTHFNNALKVTLATVTPVLFFTFLGFFEIGFTIALGAFFTYPSDIPSSLHHKTKGLLVASFLVAFVNLLVNLIHPFGYFFYPLFGLLIFIFAMISVYGQRATAVSFSCLLSICLAFAQLNTGLKMFQFSGLIFIGGIFYLIISLIFYYINPYRFIELQLANNINLIAKYLKLRADLWKIDADKGVITEKQLALQVEINIQHENIRKVLIGNQSLSHDSAHNRKLLLVFVNLVEILELALSTAFDHKTLHEKFDKHPQIIKSYNAIATNLKKVMKQISKSIEEKTAYQSKHLLVEDLKNFEFTISNYEKELGIIEAKEGVIMLTTMLHYAGSQIEKIKTIEHTISSKIKDEDLVLHSKELHKFLTPQYYPISTLINNFSFSSALFRHSLRLSITVLFGFMIGTLLPFQNVHWILLTIIVIMRPGYGLTKERSFERTLGTFLGGLIAFGCIHFIDNNFIMSLLAILSLLLGMSFTTISYKTSATFVTMYVVFLYSVLSPNNINVIQYRIIDTIVGALLAYTFIHFVWPSWEFLNTPKHIEKAILANRKYLNEIALYYNKKGNITTIYKVSRKNAFIELGNLMASFQRMSQEPKSKQKKKAQVYKLTVLNHTMLSSIASIGTYIQSHTTTEASDAFNRVIATVLQNLDEALVLLNPDYLSQNPILTTAEKAKGFNELMAIRTKEITEINNLNVSNKIQMQEAYLIIEQLVGLMNLSENILKNTIALIEKE